MEIPEGSGGGGILRADFGKTRGDGGVIRQIPSVGGGEGMDIFWNHTLNQNVFPKYKHLLLLINVIKG